MFSRFFIDRPIFAAVLSIFIVLAGLAAMRVLPISQYPEIAPPVVTVTAIYPGASAPVLESTVAAPLENAINGVENMMYMNSTSSANGMVQIQVTFEIGTDIDKATLNVNNRAKQVEPRLPAEVRRQGITVEKGSSAFLQVIAYYSPEGRYDDVFISNYVTLNVLDEIKRVPGTTLVQIFGAKDYAMRIWLRPDRLATLKLAPGDVIRAVNEQNAQFAAGKVGETPTAGKQELTYSVTTKGRLSEVSEFENVILRANGDGSLLRLKDVARVELAGKDYSFLGKYNGKPATLMGVFLQPGANQLEVGEAVRTRLQELSQRFPDGLTYAIPFDTTMFVEVSIREVVKTLGEAMLLVFLVVFLFLQNWRATLIPFAAVPVSLIGTMAGLLLLGYSINTLTLFGMVLAIGIVVDDAIVVLENVERLMRENGMRPFEAALEAMREVSGAVIAIILVLCAVFIPVAFLGGIAGQLYRQFAVTLTFAVVISGFTALTLTPALCALLMKKGDHHARVFEPFNRGFAWLTRRFLATVNLLLRHRALSLVGFVAVLAICVGLFLRVPSSFVPSEDQGYIFGAVQLPDGATLERTRAVSAALSAIAQAEPGVQNVMVINGFDLLGGGNKTNASTLFIPLRHWDERKHLPALAIAGDIARKGAALRDGMILAFNPAAIRGLGTAGGFELYLQSRASADAKRLFDVTQSFLSALRADPRLTAINSFYRPTVPQLKVEVDREKAIALGVPVQDVFDALSSTMAALYVNDFNKFGRTYRVQMQADAPFRAQPDDLGQVYVRSSSTREMIPLKSLIQVSNVVGPEQLERFNGFLAARVLGSGRPGVSSGEAIRAVEEVAAKALPEGYQIAWSGQAFQEKRTGKQSAIAFALALVMVFLILAALYERWLLPFAVVFAVPFAVLGALAFVWGRGLENDIYFQIGLVVLIGLAAKNAILIVEFAQQGFLEGKEAMEAALNAARLRFRPIVMTSLAFVLGVMPLMLSTGAGAAARRSMGTGVVGGMLAATFIATLFVPLFFVVVARRSKVRHAVEERAVPQGAE